MRRALSLSLSQQPRVVSTYFSRTLTDLSIKLDCQFHLIIRQPQSIRVSTRKKRGNTSTGKRERATERGRDDLRLTAIPAEANYVRGAEGCRTISPRTESPSYSRCGCMLHILRWPCIGATRVARPCSITHRRARVCERHAAIIDNSYIECRWFLFVFFFSASQRVKYTASVNFIVECVYEIKF